MRVRAARTSSMVIACEGAVEVDAIAMSAGSVGVCADGLVDSVCNKDMQMECEFDPVYLSRVDRCRSHLPPDSLDSSLSRASVRLFALLLALPPSLSLLSHTRLHRCHIDY